MQRTNTPTRRPAHPRRRLRRPELLAPAGGFEAAARAFEAGADGVYLGLTDFSARKGAVNFTMESLRRLKGLAAERGRRIYVTVNTVIREGELERLAESLAWLELLAVDGIFLQDPGVWRLLRRHFPGLPLIASTQMAVHNGAGIRALKKLGFRRVILPRELPLESIRRLRAEHPDIELEAFIHGALCYSYSGLCLASGLLAGRSGNRGECAQLCRNLYTEGERQGYFFSCRDLAAEEEVLKLVEIGVDAFKIEGRLKSPEYAFHTVRYYRRLLDSGGSLPPGEKRELARRRDLGFAREHTRGYLRAPSGSRLINPDYAMHKGVVLGRAEEVRARSFTITPTGDISRRDGLAFFPAESPGEPVIFSVRRLWSGPREVAFCRAGERVRIELPDEAPPEGSPRALRTGQEVWQMSSRFLDLPLLKETGFRPWRVPLGGAVTLQAARIRRTAAVPGTIPSLESQTPSAVPGAGPSPAFEMVFEVQVFGRPLHFTRPLEVQRAERAQPFADVLRSLLAESGDSPFVLEPVRFQNGTALPAERIFVPPSQLKRVKNGFYRELAAFFGAALRERASAAVRDEADARAADGEGAAAAAPLPPGMEAALAHRERLSSGDLPFAEVHGAAGKGIAACREGEADPDRLAVVGGLTVLPLPPLADEEERLFGAVEALVRAHPQRTFALGLNNLGHLELAERLAGRANVRWFVDFFAYVANRQAWRFYAERLPGLLFGYFWIEGSEADYRALQGADPSTRLLREQHLPAPPRPDLRAGRSAARGHAAPGDAPFPASAPGAVPSAESQAASSLRGLPPLLRIGPGFRPPLMISMGCHARHVAGQRCGPDCPKEFRFPLRQGRTRFVAVVRDCITYLFQEPA